jgi:Rad3-related DNA helicase
VPSVPPKVKIPLPQEIGLPEKFQAWRPAQEQALDVIITSPKRIKVVCAPTGIGKSAINVGVALHTGEPTCIVTESRALQDQYQSDFADCGMVNLKGRSNYQCTLREDYTCEEGIAANCPNRGSVLCGSSAAEMAAAASPLVVTNYSKWTLSRKFGTGMSHFTQVIFDEGDEGPDAIAQAMQVTLQSHEINDELELAFPSQHEAGSMVKWKEWSRHASFVAEDKMNEAKNRIQGVSKPKPSWVRRFTHMRNLLRRLTILRSVRVDIDPPEWIVDELPDGYVFDPVKIARYAETTLLLRVPSVIFTSATIRPKTAYMMGISKQNFEFLELPSSFPKERCPVYYTPVMRADRNAQSWDPMWLRHDQIAAKRRDRNGVTHTISYMRQQELRVASRFGDSMICNKKGEPLAKAIEDFFKTYPGAILTTPSVETGYDFKRKRAEWQFICKIPFEPPSKILKAREADDGEYRASTSMRRLVQASGRLMREETDQGETFIGDEHMDWFYPRYRHLAPNYFNPIKVDIIPPPPPRLEV